MSRLKLQDLKHGDIVFICDYRREDLAKKPIRNVKPTEVYVASNKELPKHKVIYYSDVHFRTINKNREPSTRLIPPFDSTGYRGYTGIMVGVFDNMYECVEYHRNQVTEVMTRLIEKRDSAVSIIQSEIDDLKDLLGD